MTPVENETAKHKQGIPQISDSFNRDESPSPLHQFPNISENGDTDIVAANDEDNEQKPLYPQIHINSTTVVGQNVPSITEGKAEHNTFSATSSGLSMRLSFDRSNLHSQPNLERERYIITQVLAAIAVSMGSMAVGFSAAYTSPALDSMAETNSSLNVTETQKSWIGSLMPLSALTGSLMGGYLLDALGRKMLILLCGPPFIAAGLLIGSAVNVGMIYTGRILTGLCVGLLTLTLPVYLCETIQPDIRGVLGLLPTTFGNAGILVCNLVGMYVNWSWLAYIGCVIPIVFTALMCFVPETPRWYVSKDRSEEAMKSLKWLRGFEENAEYELEDIQNNYNANKSENSSIKDLADRRYLRPFGLCVGLMLFQQLSGINAVIFYTVSIFEMAGSTINSHVSSIIVGIVNILATITANVLIDRLGRKILLYISSTLIVLSLAVLGIYFHMQALAVAEENVASNLLTIAKNSSGTQNGTEIASEMSDGKWKAVIDSLGWLPLVSFMVYVIGFSLGWGPIPWLFMGEALPFKVRGPAASIVTTINWSCTFIVTKTFPTMIEVMGPSTVFFLFMSIMIVGFLFSIFFIPETRGRTLEEIETELSGRKRERKQENY